jgi:hypothetical protein
LKFIDRKGRKDLRKGLNIGKNIYFDSGMVKKKKKGLLVKMFLVNNVLMWIMG